jgi:hypothetical protein
MGGFGYCQQNITTADKGQILLAVSSDLYLMDLLRVYPRGSNLVDGFAEQVA